MPSVSKGNFAQPGRRVLEAAWEKRKRIRNPALRFQVPGRRGRRSCGSSGSTRGAESLEPGPHPGPSSPPAGPHQPADSRGGSPLTASPSPALKLSPETGAEAEGCGAHDVNGGEEACPALWPHWKEQLCLRAPAAPLPRAPPAPPVLTRGSPSAVRLGWAWRTQGESKPALPPLSLSPKGCA